MTLSARSIGTAAPPVIDVSGLLGDMIARWRNGVSRSTLHRVVNASGHERHSVPFFNTGNPDVIVQSLEKEAEAKYQPVLVKDYLWAMYDKTYSAVAMA